MRTLFSLLILSSISVAASAAARCPWFTQGSAAAMLGGEVTSTFDGADENAGVCRFARQQAAVTRAFDIYVSRPAPSACPATSEAQVGIGTKAIECSTTHSSSDVSEQIDGEVREVHFSAILSSKGTKPSTAQRQTQRELLRHAAEQIAGNLF